jgi:hypothetical protein
MNAHIPRPSGQSRGDNALLECEEAVDVAVRDLVDQVISAGWPPWLAFAAIKSVAQHQAIAYQHDPDPADDPEEGQKPLPFPLAPF